MADVDTEPGWYWRNCRSLTLRIEFRVWPWLFGAGRDEEVYGGSRWLLLGPIGFVLSYDIGNCSAESPFIKFGALSEYEAYERALRYKGRNIPDG